MRIQFNTTCPTSAEVVFVPMFDSKKWPAELKGISEDQKNLILKSLEKAKFSGKTTETYTVHTEGKRWVVFGLGKESDLQFREGGRIGASLFKTLQSNKDQSAALLLNGVKGEQFSEIELATEIALGFLLRSYRFDKYKTKDKEKDAQTLEELTICSDYADEETKAFEHHSAVLEGTFFTRNLLDEPPNVLYPETMANRLKELSKLGIDVEILDVEAMEKLGMGSLLGVGRGSARPAKLVVMQWKGGKKEDAPLAFVGKGVTFDTGGISIKPSAKMEEMKYDMGGAAVVGGLLKTLALRKAKINAVGVVGLVENMPGGNAYRPSDILTSMSGQTIEVLNTDAEGRLVLADALWYTQDRFKPKAMIDLATLTGAMVISLGHEFAGIFTNQDILATQLTAAGERVFERVWRLPLDKSYNKMMDSTIADMRNVTNMGAAGSITAAEFLQRFVNETPWVHIDIAGVTWSSGEHPLSGSSPSGFGVRLLDTFIATYYEGA